MPGDLAGRFDFAAAAQGGRSALLRRLVRDAASAEPAKGEALARRPAPVRLVVRLRAAEAAHMAAEAAAMEMRPSGWVAVLVRRHAMARPTFARRDELALIGIHAEIRRIGVNVNQIARALNTAVVAGQVLELEMADLDAFRRELRAHMTALERPLKATCLLGGALERGATQVELARRLGRARSRYRPSNGVSVISRSSSSMPS